jgi:hypothetical protein
MVSESKSCETGRAGVDKQSKRGGRQSRGGHTELEKR